MGRDMVWSKVSLSLYRQLSFMNDRWSIDIRSICYPVCASLCALTLIYTLSLSVSFCDTSSMEMILFTVDRHVEVCNYTGRLRGREELSGEAVKRLRMHCSPVTE